MTTQAARQAKPQKEIAARDRECRAYLDFFESD
jgi:hypothetical protein